MLAVVLTVLCVWILHGKHIYLGKDGFIFGHSAFNNFLIIENENVT